MSFTISGCIKTKLSVASQRTCLALTSLMFGMQGIQRIKSELEAKKDPLFEARIVPLAVTLRSQTRLSIGLRELDMTSRYSRQDLERTIHNTELDIDCMQICASKRLCMQEACRTLMRSDGARRVSRDGIVGIWRTLYPEDIVVEKERSASIWFYPKVFCVVRDGRDGTYGFELCKSVSRTVEDLERAAMELEGIEVEGIVEIESQEARDDPIELCVEFYYDIETE